MCPFWHILFGFFFWCYHLNVFLRCGVFIFHYENIIFIQRAVNHTFMSWSCCFACCCCCCCSLMLLLFWQQQLAKYVTFHLGLYVLFPFNFLVAEFQIFLLFHFLNWHMASYVLVCFTWPSFSLFGLFFFSLFFLIITMERILIEFVNYLNVILWLVLL